MSQELLKFKDQEEPVEKIPGEDEARKEAAEKEYEFNQAALKKALEEEIKRKVLKGLSEEERKEGLRSDAFFNVLIEYNNSVGDDNRIKVDDPFALDEMLSELKILIEDLRNEGSLKKMESENNFVLKLNERVIDREHIKSQIEKIKRGGPKQGIKETWGIGLGISKDDK